MGSILDGRCLLVASGATVAGSRRERRLGKRRCGVVAIAQGEPPIEIATMASWQR